MEKTVDGIRRGNEYERGADYQKRNRDTHSLPIHEIDLPPKEHDDSQTVAVYQQINQ